MSWWHGPIFGGGEVRINLSAIVLVGFTSEPDEGSEFKIVLHNGSDTPMILRLDPEASISFLRAFDREIGLVVPEAPEAPPIDDGAS